MKNNGHEVSKKKVSAKERIIYWQTATSWNSVNEPKNIQVKSIADWTKSIKFLCSREFSTFLLDVLFSRQLALCVLIAEIYNDGKYCDKNSGNLEEEKKTTVRLPPNTDISFETRETVRLTSELSGTINFCRFKYST